MSQIEKAKAFAALHVKGRPIILYNAWDAGSAKAIADAGAKAIATSSWAVAAAQGFKDGEDLHFPPKLKRWVLVWESLKCLIFQGGLTDALSVTLKLRRESPVGLSTDRELVGVAPEALAQSRPPLTFR
jgi:hypothetical protein